jgi:hypothetical protein
VADLQRVRAHDYTLDQELEDLLFLGEGYAFQPTVNARAEGGDTRQDFVGPRSFLAKPPLLIALFHQTLPSLLNLLSAIGQLRQADDRGLIGIEQTLVFAAETLDSLLQLPRFGPKWAWFDLSRRRDE